jgi:ribonuclease VapC
VGEVVLDASAVLAALLGEPGEAAVRGHLAGAFVSAVNYSEVLAHAARLCGSLEQARRRVDCHTFTVLPFDAAQAALAASLLPDTRPLGLSLADRACLVLGLSRGATVLTADRSWSGLSLGLDIVLIR